MDIGKITITTSLEILGTPGGAIPVDNCKGEKIGALKPKTDSNGVITWTMDITKNNIELGKRYAERKGFLVEWHPKFPKNPFDTKAQNARNKLFVENRAKYVKEVANTEDTLERLQKQLEEKQGKLTQATLEFEETVRESLRIKTESPERPKELVVLEKTVADLRGKIEENNKKLQQAKFELGNV